ncbi:MAG TPA: peptidoglycan DD-metalloendopeptidase family protein [Nocardioides sp.]|nr:peptidoglycan DD-metalloendopeptidase family protein [Nocardioides sp.]
MRSFPSAPVDPARPDAPRAGRSVTRRHRLAALCALIVATGGIAAPLAHAEDDDKLEREHEKVQEQIDHAEHELEHASKRLHQTTVRLDRAQTRLGGARSHLQRVRVDLGDARLERDRLARRLDAAEKQLLVAIRELRAAREDVAAQRLHLRGTVIDMATQGDPVLEMISSYMTSGSIEETLITETAGELVVGREDQALDQLQAAEDRVQEHKDDVQGLRDRIAADKAAAQRNLVRIRDLYEEAERTRDQVARFVDQARRARQAAASARAHDQAALRRLEEREARIRRQIQALAAQAGGGNYSGNPDGLLAYPVNGAVTSPFGYREHPIYHYWGLHNGTDFGAACGAPLLAGANGTVIKTYFDSVYGHRLYLAIGQINGASIVLVYNHLSRYAAGQGTRVTRGQTVGYVGTTGWSTGCHLHFTVLRNGVPVDPMQYL